MLPGNSYTPEDILRILWRRKWLILAPLVVASLGTFVSSRKLPKLYRSETVILVVPQRVPDTYVRSTVTSRIEERLNSINSQILSRSRLEPIIRELGLYAQELRARTMEEVVESMRRVISVKVEGGNAFRVSFIDGDPRTAQKVTERLAALYITENLRDREVQAEGTNQFLDSQLDEARARLIDREKKLEAYKTRNAGELPSQVQTTLQSIQTAQLQLQGLSESIDRDRDRRVVLEKQIADLQSGDNGSAALGLGSPDAQASGSRATRDPAGPGTAVPGAGIAQQVEFAQTQLQALQARYTAEHPDVVAAKRLVQDLEAKLAAEDAQTPNSDAPTAKRVSPADIVRRNRIRDLRTEVQNLDVQMARKLSEQQRVETSVANYRAKVDAAPSREAELTELTRDYATLQQAYTGLLTKRQEATIAANLERNQVGEQFKMLDPARVPERPFSPDVMRLNLMGAVGGLAIGLALVALLEYRDSTFRTELEVARVFELPVLACVPLMVSLSEQRRHRLLIAGAATLAAATSLAAAALWKFRPF